MTATISIPGVDEQLQIACNKRARQSGSLLLDESQKFACVLVKLAPAVTQGNYPALKTAIEDISGIQTVDLLIDGQVPASIPDGTQLRLFLDAQMRIESTEE